MTIRVMIVDDQALFREGLHILLSVQAEIDVVAEAENGAHALQLLEHTQPDVVLMDLQMPIMDGVAATRRIKADYPQCHIIVLTTFDDDEYVFEGLRAGAVGYLLKDTSSENLLEAIRLAARGESFLQPSVAAKVVAEFSRISHDVPNAQDTLTEPLTPRDHDILRAVAAGMTNSEIANELVITVGTVKNHITNILGKLDVRDRTQAVIRANELNLV